MKKISIYLIAVILVFCFASCKKTVSESENIAPVESNETESMIVSIGDAEFQKAPAFGDFKNAGFEEEHATLKKEYASGSFFGCTLSDGKNSVYADFKNESEETIPVNAVPVKSLYLYPDDTSFSLPCNIDESSTLDKVKKAYGDPDKTDDTGSITYENSDGSSVEFCFDGEGKIVYVCMNY